MRYRRAERVGHLADGGQVIVAVMPDGAPRVLAGTGAVIWQLVDGATDMQLAEALASSYGVDAAEILPVVQGFCGELVGLGVLESV